MQKHHFLIIGSGIIGLATARELLLRFPGASVALLEKENKLYVHQTGRNSGVIHSGIYYRPGSLKAQTCVSGVKKIKDFACQHRIPMEETGHKCFDKFCCFLRIFRKSPTNAHPKIGKGIFF